MPELNKEPEIPKDEKKLEEAKKQCEPDKYPPEEKDAAPKWAIELGGKLDKLTDAILRSVAKPEEEVKPKEEEKKADAYPKPPDEEKKPEEKKAEKIPEELPYGKDEEKFKNMIADAINSSVEKAISKRLTDEPIEKRAKAPDPKDEGKETTFEEFGKLTWPEIHNLAKRRGA
jgi:preprotein translocase subunit SecD